MSNHSKYPNVAGIYKLTCSNNGKVYIGKSVNIRNRITVHKSSGNNSEGKWYLQNAIIKHGWDAFDVEVLEMFENFDKHLDNDNLLKLESFYIKFYDSTNPSNGYNRCEFSTDTTGKVLSEEHKEKIRQSSIGRKHSEESKEKMRHSRIDRTHSEETKKKMRKPKSEEHRKNMMKPMSEEVKIKMRKPKSEEHKKKLRKPKSEEAKANMRKPKSEEAKANMRKPKSEEHKEKLRQARLRNIQREKESIN